VFEEAMRLYPPAPSLNRQAIADDAFGDIRIEKGATILVMPGSSIGIASSGTTPTRSCRALLPPARAAIDAYQFLPFASARAPVSA